MLVQIYIPDQFSESYMPFLLFRNICERVLSRQPGLIEKVECIQTINDIYVSPETVVLMNMYDITLCDAKDYIRQNVFSKDVTFLLINTEHWELRGAKEIFEILHKREKKNIHIIEYNVINYEVLLESYRNVSVLFLPLLYDKHIESYYHDNIQSQFIPWNHKDIDILFYGGISDRRRVVLDDLKTRWNLHIVDSHHGVSNNELCRLIERSKVVVNVLYYEFNSMFDYYRNALLLSNNAVVVIETPKRTNMKHEYWLNELETHILNAEYASIASLIDQTLVKNQDEIRAITERQYAWFTRVSMEDVLVPFFKQLRM